MQQQRRKLTVPFRTCAKQLLRASTKMALMTTLNCDMCSFESNPIQLPCTLGSASPNRPVDNTRRFFMGDVLYVSLR